MKFSYSASRIIFSSRGFTLVELIVGMTVFAIGLSGILALLSHTMYSAKYSQHEVVISGILREEMELVKNMRDTNVGNYTEWDRIFTENTVTSSWTGGVYIIENDFSSDVLTFDGNAGNIKSSPVYLRDISLGFPVDDAGKWERTQLFLDEQGRYTHINPNNTNTGTLYASYIIVSPLGYTPPTSAFSPVIRDGKEQGWIIDARVLVKSRGGYREYDAKTLITDWLK